MGFCVCDYKWLDRSLFHPRGRRRPPWPLGVQGSHFPVLASRYCKKLLRAYACLCVPGRVCCSENSRRSIVALTPRRAVDIVAEFPPAGSERARMAGRRRAAGHRTTVAPRQYGLEKQGLASGFSALLKTGMR